MFGHDNQNSQQNDDNGGTTPLISPTPDDLVNDNHDEANSGVPAFDTSKVSLSSPSSSQDDSQSDTPAADDTTADDKTTDDVLPSSSGHAANDDLINIKQDALHQLSPLVDHLDQTPEEKFKTTMMMIQASDDQALVKTAYEAAKQIKDDKVRAQALLDIINEINYFTQQQNT